MASRIQGITVEIGGDTTKLSKALESVNKSIKGTQSGLKDVNKLLKLDPSNTELVVQKQKMLKDAIEATKEKLATLKTAAQQANEQLANGEITQQQYDALQREIAETEQNLRSLQDQAATTNATLAKIDEVGEKLQNIGSSVENVGKKFLPVTAAVTGLGTAAVKTAADFDSEMSKVSAISGATGDDFDQLRAKAREMGAKTKFSASEAASAMEYMAMAGWKTSDMLNGIEGIMNLAAASGEDLATTSDIVTDARAEELQSTFSYDGYQVVRKELFAHLRDPAIVIRKDSITFNTACITGLEDVVYIHVMFNNDLKRIVVRGCDENDKDALRWCIAKPDKRKSRKMSCKPFAELVYKEMDWDSECRYKVLGYRITFEGETLYVFDLLVPEIFHERQSGKKETVAEQPTDQETKPVDTRKGFYPDDIAGTFGVPVEEHLRESEVRQMDGYVSMGVLTGRTVPDTGLD